MFADKFIQRSSNIRHMDCLDHLRAVAVLMVYFAHCLHNFTRGMDPAPSEWLFLSNPILAVIAEGHSGVALFMVLSGFLFAYGAHSRQVIFVEFMRNRILRIFPMYVLLLFLGAYSQKETFSFLGFLSSLFMFSNTPGALNGGMFTILLWTISTEFTFYLLFPHLNRMYAVNGAAYFYHLLLLAIILRLICVLLGASARDFSYFTIFGRIDQFIIGMLSAYFVIEGRLKYWAGISRVTISAIIVIIMLYLFNRLGGGWVSNSGWKILWPTMEAIVFSSLVVSYVQSKTVSQPSILKNSMSFLGGISFSIYLLHQPIIAVAQKTGTILQLGPGLYVNALLAGVLVLVLVVGLSCLTYKLIEKPFMEMRRSYSY